MARPTLVQDNEVLWIAALKVGNPPVWSPSTNYNLGDTVVPTSPQPGQENVMFQCVGFLARSGGSQPVFPVVEDGVVLDNQVEWVAVVPTKNIPALPFDRYYLVYEEVTVE